MINVSKSIKNRFTDKYQNIPHERNELIMNKISEVLMHISRTLIISICVIVVAIFTVSSFIHYKQTNGVGIYVTGSAAEDFTSDLVVWSGSFGRENILLKDAYAQIKNDADNVLKYLKAKGANPNEISFSAVTTEKNMTGG